MKYLIFLDILGFYELPKEISRKIHVEDHKIRHDFLKVIKTKITYLKENNYILGYYTGADDWILLTDELNKVFLSINEILNHSTGYKNYKEIPIEIAIGIYDNKAKFDNNKLIVENETIEFLKTSICIVYRKWFKELYKESIKSTYILLTKPFFDILEPCDKHNLLEMYFDQSFVVAKVNEFKKRARMLKFMKTIESEDKYLQWIDRIFVPPLEYSDIVKSLRDNRIVFITGTPEFGKTYTALKLLWDYYNRGYDPLLIEGEEDVDRHKARKRFYESSDVKTGRIIYYEDPFGKTKYEKRESLEREIGRVIGSIKKVPDAYVIITSREEIFKEFKKENLSRTQLNEFERKLNIKRPSYGEDERNCILLHWAYAENCKWLQNEDLTSKVRDLIEDTENLPTPLNIRDFALASYNIDNKDKLKEIIKSKSMETPKAFAQEIMQMTDDKVLFLMFPFISESLEVNFIRITYNQLIEELNLESAWNFDRVLKWFKNDKITIKNGKVQFSHPSYHDALAYFLSEIHHDHHSIIYKKIMTKLSESDDTAKDVLRVMQLNFGDLPEELKNDLLIRFIENKRTMWTYSWCIAYNFDGIPYKLRNIILDKIYKKYEPTWALLSIVQHHFFGIPENLRNKIIISISEKDEVAEDALEILSDHFEIMPGDVRNTLLLNFSKNKQLQSDIVQILLDHFDKIHPVDFRNKLLLKLYENNENKLLVAMIISKYYDLLSDELKILLNDYPHLYNCSISSKLSLIDYSIVVDLEWSEKNFVTDFLKDVVFDNLEDIASYSSCDDKNELKQIFFNVFDKNADKIYSRMKEIRSDINHQMFGMEKINQDEDDFEDFLKDYSAVFLISRNECFDIIYKDIIHRDNYPEDVYEGYIFCLLEVYIPYLL